MSVYVMEYQNKLYDCVITSLDVPKGKAILLHELDIKYIQDDITNNDASNGSFTVITDEFGIIEIGWNIEL